MTNTENLKTLLNEVWKLGDRDEMSIKHIGHGLAALVAFGDWQKGIDYDRPGTEWNDKKEASLLNYWQLIEMNLKGMGRAEAIDLFESLDIAWYGAAYLEWPEYEASEVN
jgi:hypothetical protein